jgi:protein-disulfide isomerase
MSDVTPQTNAKRSVASIVIGVLGFAATLGVGFYAGQWIKETFFVPAADLEEGVRFKADLRGDEPQIGPNDALVTIVEWSDFQCPYCAKVPGPLKEAMASYEGDVRLIFKHFPLAGHAQASPAARAGWAAHQQGKFWEMHDVMFENQRALTDADFSKYAQQIGLDVARFEKDRNSPEANTAVDSDHKSGSKAGLSGTPYFLVNGHNYSGALPAKQWRQVIDYELKAAKAIMDDKGVARDAVYAEIMKDAKASRGGGGAAAGPQKRRPGEPDPAKTYKVPTDARPQHGPDDALVTVVEFSDFQCPFCSRVNPALEQLKKTYAGDLRLVFRQRPLAMHPDARDGAIASLAANRQGKFFEFHDKLFANQKDMTRATFIGYAQELGLDTAMFELDLESADLAQMLRDDEALANKLGTNGTPAFFINGRFISGAQSFESFAALVDAGTPRSQVYEKIMADAEEKPGP